MQEIEGAGYVVSIVRNQKDESLYENWCHRGGRVSLPQLT